MDNNKIMLIKDYNFWVPRTISVLGSTYTISFINVSSDPENYEAKILTSNNFTAFCSVIEKKIILSDLRDERYHNEMINQSDSALVLCYKETLRHELVHAIFGESGLKGESHSINAFAVDEELIDFIAIQSPKMFEIFKNCNVL